MITTTQNHPFQNTAAVIGVPYITPLPASFADFVHVAEPSITMSSMDIASVTGKRHDNVMHDIRKQFKELGQDALEFQGIYLDAHKRQKPCFYLPRREVDILLTGYSAKMRAAVVDRWRALEAEQKFGVLSLPKNLTDALNLACTLAYQVETLEQQIAEDAEKVEFYNEVYERTDLINPSKTAKLFGTGRNRYLEYLRKHKILMSRPHQQNMPYQRYMDAGYFEVKEGMCENPKTGERELKAHPLLTGKGLIWLQKFIAKHGRDGL
ncbi:phage regulatory protein/antirepressor Ant [Pseudomonas sp. AE27]|uniref:phage regulatory protein/antirepressor Ant n=1 Tax=Pseudomonas sp. AE27 TaxID=3127460 RepID=UPI0030D4DDBF